MAYRGNKTGSFEEVAHIISNQVAHGKDCPNPPCNPTNEAPTSLGEAFKQNEANRANNTVNLEVKNKSKKVYKDGEIYNESIDRKRKLTSEEKEIKRYARKNKLGKYYKPGDAAPVKSYVFNKLFGNKDKYNQKKGFGLKELGKKVTRAIKGNPDKEPDGSCGKEGCSAYGG